MEKEQFCCNQHRYQWHKAQRIWPGQLEERILESVREKLERRLQRRGVRELTESPERRDNGDLRWFGNRRPT
jgi:hypothetical protein